MAGEKTITTLVGKLRFEADYRPLQTFERRLDAIHTKMKGVLQLADKKISLKVKLDTKSLADNLKVAQQTKLVLKNVGVSKAALDTTVGQIAKKLATARIDIGSIRIPMNQLAAQKKLMRNLLESTTIDLPIDVRLKKAEAALRAWKQKTESKFKLYIEADISRQKFYRNVKSTLQHVSNQLGTVNVLDPKIRLKVDRAALKTEIANVLKQIERDAKIRIQLNANMTGQPRGAGAQRTSMRQHALTGGVAGAAATWGRGFVPGLGGAFAVSHLNKINQEMKAQTLALTAVMGSEQGGAQQQDWIKNFANTVGLNYRQMTPAYTKMLASGQTSGMSTESVQNIFKGVSEYGRVMGLDTEAMKGSMRAIEQMMNKGQVMSEELKLQLAERMPGVISAMAEAAGFGTGDDAAAKLFKAMENGEVKSTAVLEQFAEILARRARNGDALEKAMQSTAAQQERFNNAFSDAVKLFSEGGFDRALGEFFGKTAKEMERAAPMIRALGGAFEAMMKPVNAIVSIIGHLSSMLPTFAERLGITEKALVAIGITALANLTPLGRIVTLISAAALAIEDFMTFLDGGNSKFGEWFNNLTPEKQQMLRDFGSAMTELVGALSKLVELVWTGWSEIFGYFESEGAGWYAIKGITSMAEAITSLVNALERLSNGASLDEALSDVPDLNMRAPGLPGIIQGLSRGEGLGQALLGSIPVIGGKLASAGENNAQTAMRSKEPVGIYPMQSGPTIEKLEITVQGASTNEQTGDIVAQKVQEVLERTKASLVQTKK